MKFFLLCSIEGIACCIWLITIPTDQKNLAVGGFSLQRIVILGVIGLFSILFLILSYLIGRYYKLCINLMNSMNLLKWVGWIYFLLSVGCFCLCSIIVFPPPTLMPFGSALYQRIFPILLFGILCQFQTIVVISLLAWQAVKRWHKTIVEYFRRMTALKVIGYSLLLLSAFIAVSQVYYVYYNLGDEGDTIAVGWLVSKGWVLYKDIFSHHFPLPYLFIALVIKIFGAKILPVRLSLIILRTLCIGISMKFSRLHLPLGIVALSWSLIGYLYLGNSLLYHSFTGVFLISGFSIGLAYINNIKNSSPMGLFILSAFLGFASLSDPLKFLPAIVLMTFIIISTILQNPRDTRFHQTIKKCSFLFLGFCAALSGYILYAIITKSLADFYQNAILFNTTIYSKYSPPITYINILQSLTNFLDINNPIWFENYSPYYEWHNYFFIDHWIFTGFFYRIVILTACTFCLINRKFLLGICVYAVSSLLTLRSSVCFSAAPFVLLSFFISGWIICGNAFSIQNMLNNLLGKILGIFNIFIRVVILIMLIWLNSRGAEFLVRNPSNLTYYHNFNGVLGDAAYYRKLSCHRNDAKLLIYPGAPIIYFLAQIPPASKFLFMTPWVAEIGQEDAIKSLAENPSILYIDRRTDVGNFQVDEYLADLLNYVDHHYIPTKEKNIYVSPLLKICQ